MKSAIVVGLFGLVVSSVACGSSSSSAPSDVGASNANRLVLDVRCALDTDCPAGFECEVEVQNGVSQSDCRSHDPVPAGTTATCPAGFEPESEESGLICKPHAEGGGSTGGGSTGGGSTGSGSGGGGSTGSGSGGGGSTGSGVDDDGGAGGSKGLDDDAGAPTGPAHGACVTNADCPIGLECQIELGVASCKAHGGKR
jgi:hypothetical protein